MDQIMKWREERQTRLAGRILGNRQGKVSSAIFGTVTSSNVTTQSTDNNLPPSVAKNKPHKNPNTRPNTAPVIKHTLASKLRMIKANPLLEARGLITVPPKKKTENAGGNNRHTAQSNTVPLSSAVPPCLQHVTSFKQSSSLNLNSNERRGRRVNPQPVKRNVFVRRSLSTGPPVSRFQANKATENMNIRRIKSAVDIKDIKDAIIKEENEEQLDDTIPLQQQAQISYQTPQRARSNLSFKSVKGDKMLGPMPDVMRKRLSDWLHKRGKSFENFSHLHCFGLQASHIANDSANSRQHYKPGAVKGENKEKMVRQSCISNAEPPAPGNERPACSNLMEDNKENVRVGNSDQLVEDAIKDLLNIVRIGYPWDRCEEWLTMIRKFYPGVKEVPIYWECVAALQEVQGDFRSAVDCYEKAIIHGASLTKVGESLDQLMEKFNILNLNCDVGQDKSSSVKTPRKHEVDVRNIFKSTIIKFAQLQKALKRTNLGVEALSPYFIVTPVRRSTRASLSHYRSTPQLHYVNSLQQLGAGVQKPMVFQPNRAFDS
ncbi:uncharacterized protein LOC110840019 isoform X2 [Zootermopsis nevadensis]|uniref:uncharacterized protein LOC110840019 isoform X2 n=1 Tax=Zootermopsis nevadensis TaxID=136037 RepID=UPI000B8E5C47|nr:uncharacterized protein LOC110840019 isoform X2 [Zootermopsis nevadensis]